MSPYSRRPSRVDANQAEIVAALRAVGCSVVSLASMGDGCPDLLVGERGRTHLVEVKGEKGTLTPDQVGWHRLWRGEPVIVARSPEEAVALVRRAVESK